MNSGINLLENSTLASLTPASRRLKLLRITALFLLFSIGSSSIILFLLISLSPLAALSKKEQAARATLVQQHGDIAKLMLIHNRIQGIETLLQKRSNFEQKLTAVTNKMPPGTSITELNIHEKSLSITVANASLAGLDTFMNNLIESVEQKKEFAAVSLTNFSIDDQRALFTLTLNIVLL